MEKCKDIADEPCPVDVTGKDCNINKETKCLTRFDSMNDLFVRVRTGLPAGEGERLTVASPADCFCTAFESETSAKKLWIKGREFTLKGMFFEDKIARSLMGRLMGKFGATDRTEDTPAVPESAGFDSSKLGVVIFRLAPSHYHRYHAPVSGRILSIRKLGSRYLSVQPTIVNDSGTNVYTENVRVIVTVQLDNGSKFYIAIIGATCVGSIVLTLSGLVSNAEVKEKLNINDRLGFSDKSLDDVNTKLNDVLRSTDIRMKQNEEMGYFQYGGSTIVCAYEHDKFEFTKLGVEIKVRSTYEDETEIVVGDTILKANTA
jgi:phosphatidylserine decarboxylase